MADLAFTAAPLVLNGINYGAKHFDEFYPPSHEGSRHREDRALATRRTMEEQGYVLRRRHDVASDEEIVETVRHRGEMLPRRPGSRHVRGRRSLGGDNLRGEAEAGALVKYRQRDGDDDDASNSEASIPPRSRVRAKSTSYRHDQAHGHDRRSHDRRRRRSTSLSSSSSSTSSLGSSTDEEKQIRKMKRKKWITAALASVATIHAAQKVYTSIENHDKRIREVERGELSPQEAKKKQRSARWQDAAALGIAALGIHGAVSEWREVTEEHARHQELMETKEEHHRRRLEHERRRRAREQQTGFYKGRDGKWYYDGPGPQSLSSGGDSQSHSYSQRGSSSAHRHRLKAIEDKDHRAKSRSRGRHDNHNDDYNDDDDDDDDDDDYYDHRQYSSRARSTTTRARGRARSRASSPASA